MEPTREEPLVVVGAGLAGSLLSLVLARRGYHVDVYEHRSDSRKTEFTGGRSINLALSTRGLTALQRAGLGERILKECIPMHGRMIHDLAGNTQLQPYGKAGQYINSVSRQSLNEILMEAADAHPHVNFHFDQKCVDLALTDGSPTFENTTTGEQKQVKTRYLFGADGAYSAVRGQLQKSGRFNFSQDYLSHGYKELSIPPTADGGWRMEKNALHIWPRQDFMLIALPNLDGSFTVTLFLAWEGEYSFDKLRDEHAVVDFFHTHFPDALALMPTLVEDFFANPTGNLVTIRCAPYHYTDQVLLLGDAAHAVVPFYGQGMNASFEDCTVIDEILEQHAPDWGAVGRTFTEVRKADADAIADLALYNFLEMRSKVVDPVFLMKKKVDRALSDAFPDRWMPLYSMVTFSDIPYAKAKARAEEQDRILKYGLIGAAAGGALALGMLLSRNK
ncbi:MAG: NAD(P)/FAD-dependent oxidoreductase [bacterium]